MSLVLRGEMPMVPFIHCTTEPRTLQFASEAFRRSRCLCLNRVVKWERTRVGHKPTQNKYTVNLYKFYTQKCSPLFCCFMADGGGTTVWSTKLHVVGKPFNPTGSLVGPGVVNGLSGFQPLEFLLRIEPVFYFQPVWVAISWGSSVQYQPL